MQTEMERKTIFSGRKTYGGKCGIRTNSLAFECRRVELLLVRAGRISLRSPLSTAKLKRST